MADCEADDGAPPDGLQENTFFLLQIMSDLHLEYHKPDDPDFSFDLAAAPEEWKGVPFHNLLALLGDIGNPLSLNKLYEPFLSEQISRFYHVFLLSGNHEYYACQSFDNTQSLIADAVQNAHEKHAPKERGVMSYMWRKKIELGGFVFLGVTLWTCIQPDEYAAARSHMTDFKKISYQSGENIQPEQYHKLHAEDVAWLEEEVERADQSQKKVVIFSHHGPVVSGMSHPTHPHSHSPVGICSPLSTTHPSLFRPCVVCWCYGHTHHSNDQMVGNVRVVSNQRGYPRERLEKNMTGFDPAFSICLNLQGIELWQAVRQNDLEKAKSVLTSKENHLIVNFRWYQNQTPLICACSISSFSVEMVTLLLEFGANAHLVDSEGHSALWHLEATAKHLGLLEFHTKRSIEKIKKLLVDSGALEDPNWTFHHEKGGGCHIH